MLESWWQVRYRAGRPGRPGRPRRRYPWERGIYVRMAAHPLGQIPILPPPCPHEPPNELQNGQEARFKCRSAKRSRFDVRRDSERPSGVLRASGRRPGARRRNGVPAFPVRSYGTAGPAVPPAGNDHPAQREREVRPRSRAPLPRPGRDATMRKGWHRVPKRERGSGHGGRASTEQALAGRGLAGDGARGHQRRLLSDGEARHAPAGRVSGRGTLRRRTRRGQGRTDPRRPAAAQPVLRLERPEAAGTTSSSSSARPSRRSGKYAFCRRLIEHARELGVRAGLHVRRDGHPDAAATRRPRLRRRHRRGTPRRVEALELEMLEDGSISGLNGVLLGAAAEAGLPGGLPARRDAAHLRPAPVPQGVAGRARGVHDDRRDRDRSRRAVRAGRRRWSRSSATLLEQIEQTLRASQRRRRGRGRAEPEPAPEERPRPRGRAADRAALRAGPQDRSNAYELKRELDRLGVYPNTRIASSTCSSGPIERRDRPRKRQRIDVGPTPFRKGHRSR